MAQICVLERRGDALVSAVPAWSWDGVAPAGTSAPGWDRLRALLR
jgi:hypothetical protein